MTDLRIESANPDSHDARELIAELGAELTRVTGYFTATSYAASDAFIPRSTFIVARDAETGRALGCGAVRPLDDDGRIAELKRMYARAGTRGVGHAILEYLEGVARGFGYEEIWLETSANNDRALRFYERHGYQPIENFGPYVGRPEATCRGKVLGMS